MKTLIQCATGPRSLAHSMHAKRLANTPAHIYMPAALIESESDVEGISKVNPDGLTVTLTRQLPCRCHQREPAAHEYRSAEESQRRTRQA